MAATISDLANGVSTTSNTTCVTGGTVTASVGDWLVVVAASSNDGTAGAASQTGVVDSDGVNTYTRRALINYDPGAAGAGATLGLYTCAVTSALSSDTITVNHSVNTSEKAVQVYKVAPGAGETISFIAVDTTGVTGNLTTYAANTVSVTNGDTIFGAASIETDDAVTGDTDTTNGSWSSILTRLADGGADASTMSCASQYKTVTATGNQSWACTTVTGRDAAISYVVLRSASPVLSTVASPGGIGSLLAAAALAISGLGATPAIGDIGKNVTIGLSGTSSAAQVGTLTPNTAPTLSGVSAKPRGTTLWGTAKWGTSQWGYQDGVGSVTASVDTGTIYLTGVSSSGAVGTVSPDPSIALTQVNSVGAVGSITPSLDRALTTAAGTGAVGSLGIESTILNTGVVSPGAVESPGVASALDTTTVSAAGVVETPLAATAVTLDGATSSGAVGTVTIPSGGDVVVGLSGLAGAGEAGAIAPSVETVLSGTISAAQVGTIVPGEDVTLALSGTTATGHVGTLTASLPVPPATINYQSDGKGSGKREKRRNRTYELFTQLERTIRAELSGDTALVPAPVESATVPRRYEAAFQQLVAAAHEYAELADRLAALRADIRAYEIAQWEAQELDDEETWMML